MIRALSASLCVLFVLAHPIFADEVDDKAIEKAHTFLKDTKRGEFVTGFCHFGAKYVSHKYAKTLTVQDGSGRKVPGHFALVYDYTASDDIETQLAFLCDTRGNVYKVQVLASNGVFQSPFTTANVSIKLIGAALLEALKDNLGDDDRRLLRKLVEDADAQGLLELGLRIQQAGK